jgi:hypothetical protein
MSTNNLVGVPTISLPNEVRVIVWKKTGHQLLAGSDHSIGVDHTIVGVLGLAIGADMILRVDTSLIISGSKTSEDKSTYGSSGK